MSSAQKISAQEWRGTHGIVANGVQEHVPDAADIVSEKTLEAKRDGFVFFRQLFSAELARQAHDELSAWYERDNADREQKKNQESHNHGPAGLTIKTPPSHLLIDAYTKSPALDKIVDKILTHPTTKGVLRRMVGEHVKFRGYNVRLMTGNYDPGPVPSLPRELTLPHDWHRDSPGEFGIGIFLSDVPEGGNGGTALMRGSHMFPYCPRWHTLLNSYWHTTGASRIKGRPLFARFAVFNRLLGKLLRRRAVEAGGTHGDCYFFFNDVWHGRYQNLHGRQTMIVLIGCFPTEFPFPDEVKQSARDVLDRLPESIRKGLTAQPENKDKSTLVHWMLANRRPAMPLGLFYLARLERILANPMMRAWRHICDPCLLFLFRLKGMLANQVKRGLRGIRRLWKGRA
ncbi:MAG TPA: hypothetical protein VNX28_17045 [Gemmataceae bacterium]|nr:hypothetical protein [Gemmataceae bacterium]